MPTRQNKRLLLVSTYVVLLMLAFNVFSIVVEQNKFKEIKLSKPDLNSG
jgi:hypothetical protein